MKTHILIVEDEPDLIDTLKYNLERQGFTVSTAETAGDALRQLEDGPLPQLMLLDWMLPDLPGTEVCRRVRQGQICPELPIIMVSARDEEIDRVVGFELGVDDYVSKPFSVRELILRIEAVIRRSTASRQPHDPRAVGQIGLDLEGYRVLIEGQTVTLTSRETALLSALVQAQGRVLTRGDLLQQVWGQDADITTSAVDSHIKRLRRKLGVAGDHLQTVRGVGYSLSESHHAP